MSPSSKHTQLTLPWFSAALFAAFIFSIGDTVRSYQYQSISLKELVWVLLATLGFYFFIACIIGAIAHLIRLFLNQFIAPFFGASTFYALLKQKFTDPNADLRLAAACWSIFFCLIIMGGLIFTSESVLSLNNPRNQRIVIALFALPIVFVSGLLFFPFYRLFLLICRWLPRHKTLSTLIIFLLFKAVSIVYLLSLVDWRIFHFGPFIRLGMFIALYIVCLLFIKKTLSRLVLRKLTCIFTALFFINFIAIGFYIGKRPLAYKQFSQHVVGVNALLPAFAKIPLLDRDKDGQTRFFGQDCNDHNGMIYYGAYDVPADGIDQDCDHVDAAEIIISPIDKTAHSSLPASFKPWNKNWLIITVDTLRADHIDPILTPHLWKLTQQGAFFKNTYAQAPNTPRSFPSFLSSQYPSQIPFVNPTGRYSAVINTVAAPFITLFTVLHKAGYYNVGVFSHHYLDKNKNIYEGFDEWNNEGAKNVSDSNHDIAAPRITERVIKKLETLATQPQKKFVLWTHLFEPHSTYMPHEEFAEKAHKQGKLHDLYDQEVAFVDEYVGKLMDSLEKEHLSDSTAIVVFADHGEALGEHSFNGEQYFFHGETLYDEVLRVPFIIKIPGVMFREQTVQKQVMLLDVAPTLLQMTNLSAPPSFQGTSLLPLLYDNKAPASFVISQILKSPDFMKEERVYISPERMKAYKTASGFELYDLNKDPSEKHNLAKESDAALRQAKEMIQKAEAIVRVKQ